MAFHGDNTQSLPRRRVNLRAVCVLMLLIITVAGAGRLLHDARFDQTRLLMRQLALQALDTGDIVAADALLHRVLAISPGDVEVQEKLARLLVDHIGSREALAEAFHLIEGLLRDSAPQSELRLFHTELCLRLGDFSAADAHLRTLRRVMPDSSRVAWYSGQVADAMRHSEQAVTHLEKAIALPNPVPEAFALLARVRRELPEGHDDTAGLMDEMVDRCACADARRIRAGWYLENRRPQPALNDLWAAIAEQPADHRTNALLVRAVRLLSLHQSRMHAADAGQEIERAIAHFRQRIEEAPREPRWHQYLASVLWSNTQSTDAISVLEHGIVAVREPAPLQRMLLDLLLQAGDSAAAIALRQQLPPDTLSRAERLLFDGRIDMLQQRWDSAITHLERCLAEAGSESAVRVRAGVCLANCRQQTNDALAALNAYREVSELAPDSAAVQLGLASTRWQAGQHDLAIATWRQLIYLPGVPETLTDLLIRRSLQSSSTGSDRIEAANLLNQATGRTPDVAVNRSLLTADLFCAEGRFADALTELQEASLGHPHHVGLTRALRHLRESDDVNLLQQLKSVTALQPRDAESHAAIVHEFLRRNDANQAAGWLKLTAGIADDSSHAGIDMLLTAVQAVQLAVMQDQRYGRGRNAEQLRGWGIPMATELADRDSEMASLVVSLLAANQPEAAAVWIRSQPSLPSDVRGVCWLELVRRATDRTAAFAVAGPELAAMIHADPADLSSRILYAEALLFARKPGDALAVLQQISDSGVENALVDARIGWILAVISQNQNAAQAAAGAALQQSRDDPQVRTLVARIRLANGQPESAIRLVDGLHTASAETVRAAALRDLNLSDAADGAIRSAERLSYLDPLLPEDAELLQSLRSEAAASLSQLE